MTWQLGRGLAGQSLHVMFTSSCGFYKVFSPTSHPPHVFQAAATLSRALDCCVLRNPRPRYTARGVGAAKARQIPSWVFVDLTFQIEVQGPKLALAHIFLDSVQGEHSYYSIAPA